MASSGLLLDSSFLVALFNKEYSLHEDALKASHKFLTESDKLFITNLIFVEFATVLSMRLGKSGLEEALGQDLLLKGGLVELFVNQELYDEVKKTYLKDVLHKDISFVDLSTALVAKKMSLDVVSFDKHFKALGKRYGFKVFP